MSLIVKIILLELAPSFSTPADAKMFCQPKFLFNFTINLSFSYSKDLKALLSTISSSKLVALSLK